MLCSPAPQPVVAAPTSASGAVHTSGGAEAEQDGCVLRSSELRDGGREHCRTHLVVPGNLETRRQVKTRTLKRERERKETKRKEKLPSFIRVESSPTRPWPKRYQGFPPSILNEPPTCCIRLHAPFPSRRLEKLEPVLGEDKRCHCCALEVRRGGKMVRCHGTTCRFLWKCSSVRGLESRHTVHILPANWAFPEENKQQNLCKTILH